jgi:hypothetical protein
MLFKKTGGNEPPYTLGGRPAKLREDRRLRKAAIWLAGLVVTAAGVIITSAIQNATEQVVDVPAIKDAVRPGSDIRVRTAIVFTDHSRLRVMPGEFVLDPKAAAGLSQPGSAASPVYGSIVRQGIDYRMMKLRLLLEGRRAEEVRIIDIVPEVIERKDPTQGTFFDVPPQGVDDDINLDLDLDSPNLVLLTAGSNPGPPFFESKTISLKDREQVVLQIHVVAQMYYYSYRFKIIYFIGGEKREQIVSNGNMPFEITGPRCTPDRKALSYKTVYALQDDFSVKLAPHPEQYVGEEWDPCDLHG